MNASRTVPLTATASVHEHAWITESAHVTSTGRLRYVRCVGCAARRVDLEAAPVGPPTALTREIG
ncbi:hypothetical protein [Microbacterium testaceum]|uniref:hypothetical protein n=1 Tax=Microbacterium testaceum TaxID=2033 RepID=UPI001248D0AD|nr:hypothetical protein [Microbacterium testaceum]